MFRMTNRSFRYFFSITVCIILSAVISQIGCTKDSDDKTVEIAFTGIVNFTQGNVNAGYEESAKPLKTGDVIKEGMKITTIGAKSFAEIYVDDNVIKVMGDSVLEFSRMVLSNNGRSTRLTVDKGSVFSRITKKLGKGDEYRVKTPHAVAAVRGTEFMVSDEGERTNIACVNGRIEVVQAADETKKVILEEKEEVDVSKDSVLVKKQIEEDKMKRIEIASKTRGLRDDIRKKYNEQKKEIQQRFKNDRDSIRKAVSDQHKKDKALVGKVKEESNASAGSVKSGSRKAAQDVSGKAKEGIAEIKSGASDVKDSSKSAVEALKKKKRSDQSK
jgi:hypothetical protein